MTIRVLFASNIYKYTCMVTVTKFFLMNFFLMTSMNYISIKSISYAHINALMYIKLAKNNMETFFSL